MLVVAIAGFGALEYKGYADLVPEIGPQYQSVVGGLMNPSLFNV